MTFLVVVYRVSLIKCSAAYLDFHQLGGALIGRRALNPRGVWGGLIKLAQHYENKFKRQAKHIKELCNHKEIEISRTGKKLFSCIDAVVVEA